MEIALCATAYAGVARRSARQPDVRLSQPARVPPFT